jgi:hypothetical protein
LRKRSLRAYDSLFVPRNSLPPHKRTRILLLTALFSLIGSALFAEDVAESNHNLIRLKGLEIAGREIGVGERVEVDDVGKEFVIEVGVGEKE